MNISIESLGYLDTKKHKDAMKQLIDKLFDIELLKVEEKPKFETVSEIISDE